MSNEQMRAEFESWFITVHESQSNRVFSRLVDDRRYESMETEYAWLAWNRATSGAASGDAKELVQRMRAQAGRLSIGDASGRILIDAAMMIDYLYKANTANPAEQSAPPVPQVESLTAYEFSAFENGERQRYALLSDVRALLATQSASTAPGQAELERDAARYRCLADEAIYQQEGDYGWYEVKVEVPLQEDVDVTPEQFSAAVDQASAALSKEKP